MPPPPTEPASDTGATPAPENERVRRAEFPIVRILIANRFGEGATAPTGRMLTDLAMVLRGRGHAVAVLAADASYHGTKSVPLTAAIRRFGQWIGYWMRFWLEARAGRADIVVMLTDPPFLPFIWSLVPRTRRRLGVWWTMDLYPEALVAASLLRAGGPVDRFLRRLNDRALSRLHGVMCLGERQRSRLESYPGWRSDAGFSTVVPPWDLRSLTDVKPAENSLINDLGWQGKRVVLYAGNLGYAHVFEPLIAAAQHLDRKGDPSWLFAFVVSGRRKAELIRAARPLRNVTVLDYVPSDRTAELLCGAAVHVVTMADGWDGIVVPSKLYGILGSGRPVLFIGPAHADTACELKGADAALTLPAASSGEDVVEALDWLAQRSTVRRPDSSKARGPTAVADFLARTISSCYNCDATRRRC